MSDGLARSRGREVWGGERRALREIVAMFEIVLFSNSVEKRDSRDGEKGKEINMF